MLTELRSTPLGRALLLTLEYPTGTKPDGAPRNPYWDKIALDCLRVLRGWEPLYAESEDVAA